MVVDELARLVSPSNPRAVLRIALQSADDPLHSTAHPRRGKNRSPGRGEGKIR